MEGSSERADRQLRVAEALQDRSTKLASMYRAALSALGAPPEPGGEAVRISIICHCMREVVNGLPAVLTDGASPRPNPSSGALANRLPALLADHPNVDLDVDQDLVPVPKAVAQAFSAVVSAVTIEEGLNRRNAAELVTGGSDSGHPVVAEWRAAQRFFLQWTHLDRNRAGDRDLPTDAALLTHMRVVEDVIEVRSGQFFVTLDSVRDLLSEANMIASGGVE